MASSLSSLHHHHHHHHHFPPPDTLPTTTTTTSSTSISLSFIKPSSSSKRLIKLLAFSAFSTPPTPTTSSLSSTTSPPSSSSSSLDLLQTHLSNQDFREADEETRRLLIVLAGEAAQRRGYVFFTETQFIPTSSLAEIDELWRKYSNGKFGYSVQKKVWRKVKKDFSNFFVKVGWMKKMDTEVEQYNYRSFPNEFVWELGDETPVGHLPLTNCLRGTQLLNSVLNHPAFEEEEGGGESSDEGEEEEDVKGLKMSKPAAVTVRGRSLSATEYTF